jgi:hypothetical protein
LVFVSKTLNLSHVMFILQVILHILVIKPTSCTKSFFGIKLCMFRTVPLSVVRSFSLYTQQWYMSYKFADSLRAGSGRNLSCSQSKTPDDGQRNCPKHVEFCYKNKFGELMHLVGFIIKIYNDAQSPALQIILHN